MTRLCKLVLESNIVSRVRAAPLRRPDLFYLVKAEHLSKMKSYIDYPSSGAKLL